MTRTQTSFAFGKNTINNFCTIIMNKLELLEFSSRVGSILVWIGLWNIIVIMVDETNILKNILVFIFGIGQLPAGHKPGNFGYF